MDNLSLARKEGWRDMVNAVPLEQPESLSVKEIRMLSNDARDEYNDRRNRWHAQMGTIMTGECRSVLEQLEDAIKANPKTGADCKPMLALSGLPGLGKSTVAHLFGARYHQQQIAKYGPFTPSGDERWPVCRVGMTGTTGVGEFMAAVCSFYAHPGYRSAKARDLSSYALDCVSSCATHLLIIDNLHFLHGRYRTMPELSNQFKSIADDFGVTVLFIGIGLHERHALLDDYGKYKDHEMEQLLRCAAPVDMSPFNVDCKIGREQWHYLLRTLEQRLMLARKHPGMLAVDLSDYLFIRSTGHIGSLMNLLRLGCQKAMRTGTETLTAELLDKCRIDSAAELGRRELAAAFRTGKKTTKMSGQ
ncbi:AAA family ATPase [Mycolicibacterium mucogenicum]|uniref:AAA family ATPase n=1 Tax=Mycolicibacterium mucogenicum TaxID=56689 RepID=A0A1A3H4K0_MYCMU|nr:AAA family ATPase [Mycolicibacterium mucogenicum]